MLHDYCRSRLIPHKAVGKVIVATAEAQRATDLPRIIQRARRNGVHDLQWLSTDDVRILEPEVRCGSIVDGSSRAALFSPSTKIVDSHALMTSLLADAESHGAVAAFRTDVAGLSSRGDGIDLDVEGGPVRCRKVINCGGLRAAELAAFLGAGGTPRHYFAKGNYFRLEAAAAPFRHLVYPVPEAAGLGVHATLDLGGRCRFGPDVEWVSPEVKDPEAVDLTVDPARAAGFYGAIRRYWPALPEGSLAPDYAGVRPKRYHPEVPGSSVTDQDFYIQGPADHGVSGLVNLIGIESPGLTSCMAIAEHVYNICSKIS